MTARETVALMLAYLREEQRGIPYGGDTAYVDPIPDAVSSINNALQQMAVIGPLFAAKQQKSAFFRAPFTVAVTGLTNGGQTATGAFPAYAAGCWVQLPGDPAMNRITGIAGTTASLQFPHLSATASGDATVNVDTVELDADVITVLEPVRYRNSTTRLRAVSNREELVQQCGGEALYFIESTVSGGSVKLRMMLSGYVSSDTVIEFQSRASLGVLTVADIYATLTPTVDPETALPVANDFIDSILLPLALDVFFSKPSVTNYDVSSLRNQDAPALIRVQAQRAMEMLKEMRPQGHKPTRLMPGLRTSDTRSGYQWGGDGRSDW